MKRVPVARISVVPTPHPVLSEGLMRIDIGSVGGYGPAISATVYCKVALDDTLGATRAKDL